MKKLKIILPLLVLTLLLTACFPKKATSPTEALKQAVTGNKGVKCTFEQNGQMVTTYAKGEKSKVEGFAMNGGGGGMVNDGEYMYMWGKDKTGTKYKLSAVMTEEDEETEPADMGDMKDFEFEEWMETQEEEVGKVDCKAYKLSDSDFVPPSDVTFKDITQTFEKMNEFSEKMEANPGEMPSAEDMEGLNQMMEDMGGAFGGSEEMPQIEE
jgi:hypothetical protein